jgi:glycine/D-amino acid oxidase-like deaminating enzyme
MSRCLRARAALLRPPPLPPPPPPLRALRRLAARPLCAAAGADSSAAPAAPPPPVAGVRRVVVLGAGFAGVATCYHLLRAAGAARLPLRVQLLDAVGLGGGASGVAAGLLHPFAPRGVDKLLWRGAEGYASTCALLDVAHAALGRPVATRAGTLHPPPGAPDKQAKQEGASDAGGVRSEYTREALSAAQAAALLPGLALAPDGGAAPAALLFRGGVVVHPRAYLAGLWAACEAEARAGPPGTSARLLTRRVPSLAALLDSGGGGDDDDDDAPLFAVVVATGAATALLPELASLPLSLRGGATAHFAAAGLPLGAPALIAPGGAGYLAPDGEGGVTVGATPARRLAAAHADARASCFYGAAATYARAHSVLARASCAEPAAAATRAYALCRSGT